MVPVGNTEIVIGTCVVVTAVPLWRTGTGASARCPRSPSPCRPRSSSLATHTVGRLRPPVLPEDPSPPTSSYPSGHVGAATALYASFALMVAERIERDWLRRFVIALCVILPLLVTYARLYRGAHHISDVVVGIANGLVCAGLAYAGTSTARAHEHPREGPQHCQLSSRAAAQAGGSAEGLSPRDPPA